MNAERQAREDKREQKIKEEQLKKTQEKFEAERKVKLTQNAERKEQVKTQEKQQETLVKKEQEINQTAKFKCPKCNRGFNNKGSLTNHERSCVKKQEA
jgi:transposase-like protein